MIQYHLYSHAHMQASTECVPIALARLVGWYSQEEMLD